MADGRRPVYKVRLILILTSTSGRRAVAKEDALVPRRLTKDGGPHREVKFGNRLDDIPGEERLGLDGIDGEGEAEAELV